MENHPHARPSRDTRGTHPATVPIRPVSDLSGPMYAGMIEITLKSDLSDEEGLACPTPNG